MSPEVSIVIVCMNRPDNLRPCLGGIRRFTKLSYETFVVAYRFSPGNLAAMREEFPWVRFMVNDELSGFSRNNNLALRNVGGEFTFIVNDDTFLRGPLIDDLAASLRSLPEKVATVSPKIVWPDGRVQTCGRERPSALRYAAHYLGLVDETRPGPLSMQSGLFRTGTLNGACFLARTSVFREAGWFDETYTFTPEDLALGALFEKMGYENWADSRCEIIHAAGATASRYECAIKPARVRGSLIFYSSLGSLRSPQGTAGVNPFVYGSLGLFCWCYEALRSLKYLMLRKSSAKDAPAKLRRRYIMARTARNVRRSIFTRKLPDELFKEFFGDEN